MSGAPGPVLFDRVAIGPDDVNEATLLGVCASLKPAAGRDAKSAVRNLLRHALATVGRVYPDVRLLDLHAHPLPLFDGRAPEDIENADVALVRTCLQRAGSLLLGVPAYWSGVSGVFKNMVDVACGPAYDLPKPVRTLFTGKPVGLLIVGADGESAAAGAKSAEQIMLSTGARIIGRPAVLGNPRAVTAADLAGFTAELVALTAELARNTAVARVSAR